MFVLRFGLQEQNKLNLRIEEQIAFDGKPPSKSSGAIQHGVLNKYGRIYRNGGQSGLNFVIVLFS